MLGVFLRTLRSHVRRTVMTSIAVVIGVALIAWTLIFSDTINKSFDEIGASSYSGVAAVVTPREATGTPEDEAGVNVPTLPKALLDRVAGIDGVERAAGQISGQAIVFEQDGKTRLGGQGPPSILLSTTPDGFGALRYVEGRAPQSDREVAFDPATAEKAGVSVGDTVSIQGEGRREQMRLVGLAQLGEGDTSFGGATVTFTTENEAAKLTGRTPDALIADLQAPAALPALPDRLDAATPGELLRRRPDVAAAEQRLHAATARIGVATADLFPRFTLGGLLGTQAAGTGALFERDSETHLLALGVDWSFLDVGHVRARIAESGADAEAALAQYCQAVLLALEDTENALVRYAKARAEDAQLERAAADSADAARLARVRYEAGAIGLLDVLDAERSRLQAQDAFADARTRSITGAVSLYQALAGGWPQRVPQREGIAQR